MAQPPDEPQPKRVKRFVEETTTTPSASASTTLIQMQSSWQPGQFYQPLALQKTAPPPGRKIIARTVIEIPSTNAECDKAVENIKSGIDCARARAVIENSDMHPVYKSALLALQPQIGAEPMAVVSVPIPLSNDETLNKAIRSVMCFVDIKNSMQIINASNLPQLHKLALQMHANKL
jgi:hypothetical protein